MLSSASATTSQAAARPPLLFARRRPAGILRDTVAVSAVGPAKNLASSSPSPSPSSSSPLPMRLSCRRRRRLRPAFAPSAVPAAYLDGDDDDEDFSLNVDDLDALTDDELADLLADRNPKGYTEETLLRKVRGRQEAKRASIAAQYGDSVLKVELADALDPFDCWLWFEAGGDPSAKTSNWTQEDAELLDGVLTAWFMLGRLGGFNSGNLQLSQQGRGRAAGAAKEYDTTQLVSASTSVFHDFSPRSDLDDGGGGNASVPDDAGALEVQGRWARAWVNCGTADELAFDVLLNALSVLASEDVPALSKVVVGGELPWWPVPKRFKGAGGAGAPVGPELEGLLEGDY